MKLVHASVDDLRWNRAKREPVNACFPSILPLANKGSIGRITFDGFGQEQTRLCDENLRDDSGSEIWLSERFVLFMGIEP